MLADIYISLIDRNYLLPRLNKPHFFTRCPSLWRHRVPHSDGDTHPHSPTAAPPKKKPPIGLVLSSSASFISKHPFSLSPSSQRSGAVLGSQQSSSERLLRLSRVKPSSAAAAAAPLSEAPSAASGDGTDHIAACMFENTDGSEAAAGSSLALLALLMDRVTSQQLLGREEERSAAARSDRNRP